jgi:hypothetical protein
MRISFPVFWDEEHPAYAEEMNAFYTAFREAAAACASAWNRRDGTGGRTLLAEYRICETGQGIVVVYRLTVRRHGRILAEKRITHVWKEGMLVPEKKGFLRIFTNRKKKSLS